MRRLHDAADVLLECRGTGEMAGQFKPWPTSEEMIQLISDRLTQENNLEIYHRRIKALAPGLLP